MCRLSESENVLLYGVHRVFNIDVVPGLCLMNFEFLTTVSRSPEQSKQVYMTRSAQCQIIHHNNVSVFLTQIAMFVKAFAEVSVH